MLAVVDTYVMDGHDVRMLEKSGRGNLAPEPLDDLLAREWTCQNHFQRHNAPETGLARAINHAHAATGNFFEQFVIAEATNRLKAGRRMPGISCRGSSYWGRVGKLADRALERCIETAFEQAASAKALRLVRVQFGATPRA
jgi:hypothetical protein